MFPEKGRCINTRNHDQQCSNWLGARQQRNYFISLKKTPVKKLDKCLDLYKETAKRTSYINVYRYKWINEMCSSSSYSKLSVMEADRNFSLRAVSIGQRHKWAGHFPLSDVNRGRIWNSSFWETVYYFFRLYKNELVDFYHYRLFVFTHNLHLCI